MSNSQNNNNQTNKLWSSAFHDLLADYGCKNRQLEPETTGLASLEQIVNQTQGNVNPDLEVWRTAFKNVVNNWKVNPVEVLTTVVAQTPKVTVPTIVAPVQSSGSRKKANWKQMESILKNNNITYFYHFTDRSNLDSIRKNGGLYSWYSCDNKGISISRPGGDPESRMLDTLHNLHDYVRLSFCDDHPMAFRHKQDGANLVLLKIMPEVAFFKDTLFSNCNAASNGVVFGGDVDDLKRVNFNATKRHYVSRNDPDFAEHQAECMVKTFVPLKYIANIDNPIVMN